MYIKMQTSMQKQNKPKKKKKKETQNNYLGRAVVTHVDYSVMQTAFHNQTIFIITATVLRKLQSKYSPVAVRHRCLLQGYETLRCGW